MISRHDLLYHAEEYQPLGSIKGMRNLPVRFAVDMNDVMRSQVNMLLLCKSVYRYYRQNGGRASYDKICELVEVCLDRFMKEYDINDFISAEWQATGNNNYSEALNAANNMFMKKVYDLLPANRMVPTREYAIVGPHDAREVKRYSELTAADIPTIDVWAKAEVQVINKQFRDNNRIPFWQCSMHKRHYDRGNDGFRENDPDRASLENPIYAYDMSNIHANIDHWKKEEWFGF